MISVILLAHNGYDLTFRALTALADDPSLGDAEIILVDNASTDETPKLPERFSDRLPRLVYRRHDENLHFSRANNLAVTEAKGDRLLFLNNDVYVWPETLGRLASVMDNDHTVGAVGGRLYFPQNGLLQHAGIIHTGWGYAFHEGAFANADDPRFSRSSETFALLGALLLIDHALFERIDGFDEQYQWGYEDIDLSLKVRAAGRKVIYAADAQAWHHESITVNETKVNVHFQSNYQLYRKKWDDLLLPKERAWLQELRDRRIESVLLYGAGEAARRLSHALADGGIDTRAFISSDATKGATFLDRPLLSPRAADALPRDVIFGAAGRYYEIEKNLLKREILADLQFPRVW